MLAAWPTARLVPRGNVTAVAHAAAGSVPRLAMPADGAHHAMVRVGASVGACTGPSSCALGGPTVQQVRHRQWLFPKATKGWRPGRFEHEGQALKIARESKRIPIWKLSWAANVSENFLRMVERGDARLPKEQREELERLVGVPVRERRLSKIDRAP
eukprot:TRINITY_DN59190_c0_g1_i1.p3 TRINITY_DN59190_c0_g1~~TRINITY_DN59190_c0_g1_i1.p3  ORF type:complete len:171 (+),score=18.96 TRINITY_DN59190_c0_g1_i1:43-513(+)